MAAGGNPNNVKLGPGRLYYAPLGTADPTLGSAALPSQWQAVGYTEDGTEIQISQTDEDVDVAEELDPIDNLLTKRTTKLVVEAAEVTKKNLLLFTGGGASNTNDGVAFELVDPSSVVGVMMVWDSSDTAGASGDITNRRYLFRKVKPGGDVNLARKKAPAKATIPATLNVVKPDATNKSFKVFPDLSGIC